MPLSWNEIRARASAFSKEFENDSCEIAEAKTFWDAFFEVFGVTRRRTAQFEKPVRKSDGHGGYIDLLWKGVMLVEHKSRGSNLDLAYHQATDYFYGLKDRDLPRYVVVSDFATFRLYDLDAEEIHEFPISQLRQNVRHFGFIAGYETQRIKEREEAANVRAAEQLGKLHDQLKSAGYEGHALEVLLVRILFCLFADDSGIFEKNQFFEYLDKRTTDDGADLGMHLAQLFEVLNTPVEARHRTLDEQLSEFPYINGRLFDGQYPIPSFSSQMRHTLLDSTRLDWGGISPAIFGSLFQSIMIATERRNLGAHYTREANILKAVKPLFLDALRDEFESIGRNSVRLLEFQRKLAAIRILDPACGCGNFLVIAYRELRFLELEILRKLYLAGQSSRVLDVKNLVFVDVDQFYGIEIEDFPCQVAQVALWLTDHQMNQLVSAEFGQYFARLPLSKSPSIVHGNALRLPWEQVIEPTELTYVVGNPPYKGHHLQTPEEKADMVRCLSDDGSAGVLDYVSAWFAKAAAFIRGTRMRVAFVATNSITQGEQVGILWRILQSKAPLSIHFAHRTFRWTNEAKGQAAVHCVIIGFAAYEAEKIELFDYVTDSSEPVRRDVKQINAYLVEAPWVLLENRSRNPFGMPDMQYGNKPTDGGHFLFTDEEKVEFLDREPGAERFIKPFLSAHEYLHGINRWVLWLVDANPDEIASMPLVRERVEAVDSFRKASKAVTTRNYRFPWLFRQITQPKSDYVLIPAHTSENRRYVPFGFFAPNYIVGNSCFSLPGASLFHFGVIQSAMHMTWMGHTCGRIKSDYRYSKDIVYNNFPWPNDDKSRQSEIADAAQTLLDVRAQHIGSTLANLYDALLMPVDLSNAHQALDQAVDRAYSKKRFRSDAARIAFLFERYQQAVSPLVIEGKSGRTRRRGNTDRR